MKYKHALRPVLPVLFILIGVALGLLWKNTRVESVTISQNSAIIAPGFNPKFSLVNHEGQAVTENNYNDKYQLVYFGFTFCPEICPTELQKMARALEQVGDDAKQIYPLFVSVDPQRDTPDVMKQYLSNFGEEFIGLTGTEAQVDKAMSSFKVYAAREEDPAYADYMMAHSSYIYFLNQKGDLLGLYKKEDTAEMIAEKIRSVLKN